MSGVDLVAIAGTASALVGVLVKLTSRILGQAIARRILGCTHAPRPLWRP
jgi:hypothetical protein